MDEDLLYALHSIDRSTVTDDLVSAQVRRMGDVSAGRQPDRTPFQADLRWWFVERYHNGTLEQDLAGVDLGRVLTSTWFSRPRALIDAERSCRATTHPAHTRSEIVPGIVEEATWSGDIVRYVNGGYPGSHRNVRLVTPVGTLTAAESYSDRSFGIHEYPVKTAADLAVVRHVYQARAAHLTHPAQPMPWSPIQEFLVRMAGAVNGTYLLFDEKEQVEETMRVFEETTWPMVESIARTGYPGAYSCENISADVSGGYFDAYFKPQMLRRTAELRRHGIIHYNVHQDGRLKPVFGRLGEANITAANGITAAPAGDVEPEDLRPMVGPDFVIMDIIPQVMFTPAVVNEDDFLAYVKRVISHYRRDNRIIFGIGDMLPVNGSIRRVETVIRMLETMTSR